MGLSPAFLLALPKQQIPPSLLSEFKQAKAHVATLPAPYALCFTLAKDLIEEVQPKTFTNGVDTRL